MSRLERIVAARGGVLLDAGRRALICGPGHGPKDRSVSLVETEDGRVLIHCFSPRDDWRCVRDALAARGLLDDDAARERTPARALSRPRIIVQPEQEERVARARRLWDEAQPISGTIAERYLRNRAITTPASSPDALRLHPRMTSLDDRVRRPALMAALLDADGVLQGVQATLLSTHGSAKAPVATPRRVIGRLMGGAVRLSTFSDALIIAEGVETALSASAALGLPAWAALTADNLARFDPPGHVPSLVIASDNDPAGRAAAAKLRDRVSKSINVTITPPPQCAKDWNDWARASAPKA